MTVTILASDLARILSEASQFAHRGTDLPMINCVRLEADGGRLTAVATDRFRLGASSAELAGGKPRWQIMVPLSQVKLLGGAAKLAGRLARVELYYISGDNGELRLDFDTLSMKVIGMGGHFPKWRDIVASASETPDSFGGYFAVNPQYMATFGKVKRNGGGHMRVRVRSASKVILVLIGDDFVGAIMPVRDQMGEAVPQWAK